MRDFDEAGRWSLFIPVTLAVALGVLIANGVSFAVGVVFFDRPLTPSTERAAGGETPPADVDQRAIPAPSASAEIPEVDEVTSSPASQPTAAVASVDTPAPQLQGASRPGEGTAAVPTPSLSRDGLRQLMGPTGARQNRETEACINGTVALRAANGWQQKISEQQPERCVATSP